MVAGTTGDNVVGRFPLVRKKKKKKSERNQHTFKNKAVTKYHLKRQKITHLSKKP
jgi:hypothetical protein